MQITLYVPQAPLNAWPRKQEFLDTLLADYGGFTCTEGIGSWLEPKGNICTEEVYIYTIWSTTRKKIASIVRVLKKELHQAAVLYAINTKHYIV